MAKKIEINENWEPVEVEDLSNLFVVIFKHGSFDNGYIEAFDTDDVLMQSAYDSLANQYNDCGCDKLTKIYLIKIPNTEQTVNMCNTGLFNGSSCDPHVIEATRDLFNRADCEHLSCWEGCGLTEGKKKKKPYSSAYCGFTDPELNIKHFNQCMGTGGLQNPNSQHLVVGDTLPNAPVADEGSSEGTPTTNTGEGGAVGESLTEAKEENLEEKVREIVKGFINEDKSRMSILEYDDGYNGFVEKFDKEEIDFGKFIYNDLSDEEIEEGRPVITFLLSGGLNGSGSWVDYLADISKLFKEFEDKLKLHAIIYKLDTDILDDVWTAEVLLYIDRDTVKESLNEDLIVIEPEEGKKKIEELKAQIENCGDPKVRKSLLTLMNIYLFQTYKPSDRENSTLTDDEWQEIADWHKEETKDEKLDEELWPKEHNETTVEYFETDEVMKAKVKDWLAAEKPCEYQIEDVPADLTWEEVINAYKEGKEPRGGLHLDTEPREYIWQRAGELYYLQTGKFLDADFERIYKEKRTDLQTPEEKVEGEEMLLQTKPGVPEDEVAVEEPAEEEQPMEEQLNEAHLDYNTQKYKMDALDTGARGFNAAAASDEKLEFNWNICRKEGFDHARGIIEQEMLRRGGRLADLVNKSRKTKVKISDYEYVLDPGYINSAAVSIVWHSKDKPQELINYYGNTITDILMVLAVALLMGEKELADTVKDHILDKFTITLQELKDFLNKGFANKAFVANLKQTIKTTCIESLEEDTAYSHKMLDKFELPPQIKLDEAKRYVKRYYVRPLNIFCGNKEDIIQALIRAGDQNCSVYSLKRLDNHEDVHLLQPSDIIYYWDEHVLYDKNHVQVMDYDLFVKHEEDRRKVGNVDAISDATFSDMYDDRATEDDLKDKDVIANYKALNNISR